MNIITVGIGLAKNVFAVHCVNDSGKPALVKPKVQRVPSCSGIRVVGGVAFSAMKKWYGFALLVLSALLGLTSLLKLKGI